MKAAKKTMPISKALTEVWKWKEEVYAVLSAMGRKFKQGGVSKMLREPFHPCLC